MKELTNGAVPAEPFFGKWSSETGLKRGWQIDTLMVFEEDSVTGLVDTLGKHCKVLSVGTQNF